MNGIADADVGQSSNSSTSCIVNRHTGRQIAEVDDCRSSDRIACVVECRINAEKASRWIETPIGILYV